MVTERRPRYGYASGDGLSQVVNLKNLGSRIAKQLQSKGDQQH